MSDYYKDELLHVTKDWSIDQIDQYISVLEKRITATSEHIRLLKEMRRKRLRKVNHKDTGSRGGI